MTRECLAPSKLPTTSHWAYPAAIRALRALAALHWSGTTWQIGEQYETVAAHTDIDALRHLFGELGVADWQNSVLRERAGSSDGGRDVHVYTVPVALRGLAARILVVEQLHPNKSRPNLDRLREAVAEVAVSPKQAGLF